MIEITFAEIFAGIVEMIVDILKFATMFGGGVLCLGLLGVVVIFFAAIFAPLMD